MGASHLIYFADPMCSWCWGFSPVMAAVETRWGSRLPTRVVMGGLRPAQAEPTSRAAAASLRGHWTEITAASGQVFDRCVIDRGDFVYDTDPAAHAVVLARQAGAEPALAYLRSAHAAFYVEGRDITDPAILADLAAELGFARTPFLAGLADEAVKQETWGDYALAQRAGVRGFPTLIVGPMANGEYALITRGWADAASVLTAIDSWLADQRALTA